MRIVAPLIAGFEYDENTDGMYMRTSRELFPHSIYAGVPEEESFDHVPTPSEVRFLEYSSLFEVLRRFTYSGDEEV
jgi:hypothetical protein